MGPMRQLWNSFFVQPVLAVIRFLLTLPLWRGMRARRVKRDEESDLIGSGSNDQNQVNKESADNSEVPSVAVVPVPARQSAPMANTDEDSEDILEQLKTEGNDLTEDELYCEYDSTWETSSPNESKRFGRPRRTHYRFDRFKNAARDMWNYRHDYPDKSSHKQWHQEPQMPNLEFYVGNIPSSPDGIFIDQFHSEWLGDYYKLEYVHTFIQWLFPLQEPGVNYQAKELTKEEIQAFRKNDNAKRNLLESYKLMLDFYGINLSNEETGEVERAPNWAERFDHLNSHCHNYLRISRILKCLGTLGYSHFQAPLVRFFLQETLVHGNIPKIKESLLNYFMFAVLDKTERKRLVKFAYLNHDPQEEFVWCPKMIQMRWQQQVRTKNQDDAQDFWSSTSKPSAAASPSMKKDKPLECEDEVGDEARPDTSPGITGKPDSEFESQRDEADADLDLVSPSPVGGDDQATETGPNGDEEHMEIPRSQMNPNEESSSTGEGPRNEEGDGDSDDYL